MTPKQINSIKDALEYDYLLLDYQIDLIYSLADKEVNCILTGTEVSILSKIENRLDKCLRFHGQDWSDSNNAL